VPDRRGKMFWRNYLKYSDALGVSSLSADEGSPPIASTMYYLQPGSGVIEMRPGGEERSRVRSKELRSSPLSGLITFEILMTFDKRDFFKILVPHFRMRYGVLPLRDWRLC
jgi:hypothetical protein